MKKIIITLLLVSSLGIHEKCYAQSSGELARSAWNYATTGDCKTAISLFQRSIQLTPTADGYYGLGVCHFFEGTIGINTTHEKMREHQRQSEKALLSSLQLSPNNADAHNYLGQLYGTWGQHNSAILQFQKAVKLEPKHNEAWLYLGMDYYRLGMMGEAITALRNAQNSKHAHIRERASNLLNKILKSNPGGK